MNLCLEEQEFLGELAEVGHDDSIFKRDHVFVQLNFKLKTGKLQVEITNLIGSKMVLLSAAFSVLYLSVSIVSIVNMYSCLFMVCTIPEWQLKSAIAY